MDYDNFRQMVLGANIFSVKSKEFNTLLEQKYKDKQSNF